MPKIINENQDLVSPATILDNDTIQLEFGVDGNDSDLVKLSVQSSGGATFGNPMVTLDSSANGNVIITPNGTGTLQVDSLGAGMVQSDASGNLSVGAGFFSITSLDDTDSTYTVLDTDQYLSCDVSGGILDIDLPNAPTTGRVIYIKDSGGDANTNNITVSTVGGAVNIDGATSYVMNTNFQSLSLIFDGNGYQIF